MAKIINFSKPQQESEHSILALFCHTLDCIFTPARGIDPPIVARDLVMRIIRRSRENPHYFKPEKVSRLKALVAG